MLISVETSSLAPYTVTHLSQEEMKSPSGNVATNSSHLYIFIFRASLQLKTHLKSASAKVQNKNGVKFNAKLLVM